MCGVIPVGPPAAAGWPLTIRAVSADGRGMPPANLRAFARVAAIAVVAGAAPMLASPSARANEQPEPPVGGPGPEGDYLRQVHQRLHGSWVDGFIRVTPYS